MRLIDADFLKANEAHYDEEGVRIFYENEIDNAPTAEPQIKNVPVAKVSFDKEQLQEIVDKVKLEILASVERPQGRWIKQEWGYVCSVCGESNDYAYDNNIHKFTDYFCPNCGAKMDGQEAEDETN